MSHNNIIRHHDYITMNKQRSLAQNTPARAISLMVEKVQPVYSCPVKPLVRSLSTDVSCVHNHCADIKVDPGM